MVSYPRWVAPDILTQTPLQATDKLSSFIESCSSSSGTTTNGRENSFLDAWAEAVPELMDSLGALGEHAYVVGIAFAVLYAAGRSLMAANAVVPEYTKFNDSVLITARLLLKAETQHRPCESVALSPLEAFWAALYDFVDLIATVRGSGYLYRLLHSQACLQRLENIAERVEARSAPTVALRDVNPRIDGLKARVLTAPRRHVATSPRRQYGSPATQHSRSDGPALISSHQPGPRPRHACACPHSSSLLYFTLRHHTRR